mgnify:CR=1 FL=1
MKLVLLSDTHGQHENVAVPDGDILIHAGDLSLRGTEKELTPFMDWFGALPHSYKILIAGNHDFLAEKDPKAFQALLPPNVIYLNDSGCEIEGIKIWGSPIQPWFHDWAFNRMRGDAIQPHWDLIPMDTDILITHGPPFGTLDRTTSGNHVGCEVLAEKLAAIQPKLHVFGHIHESHGLIEKNGTVFVNASVLNFHYQNRWQPFEIDWEEIINSPTSTN